MLLKELFVALGLEVDEAAFAKGQLAASLVEAGMRKIVEIGKEVVDSFIENTKEAIEYGDQIRKTSQSVGIAIETLQELQYAGQMSGVSAQEMTGAIRILSRNMNAAKGGAEEQGKAFSKLGVKVTDASGKLRSADEVISDVAEKLGPGGMPDGAEKTALAMQIFGKSGARLIPLLNEGAEGIAELRQEAQDMGLVMGEDSARAAEELGDNLERLHALSKGLWRGAIAPLLPEINKLVKRFLEWKKANAQIISQRIRSVLQGVLTVVRGLGHAFQFVVDNATALKFLLGVGGVLGTVIALAGWMSKLGIAGVWAAVKVAAAWVLAAAPFILIGAMIAGFMLLFDDIRTYQKGGDSMYGRFKKEIDSWLEPKSDDPWFLKAFKEFLNLLKETIEVLLELDEVFGDGEKKRKFIDKASSRGKKGITADADNMTIESARKRASMGLPLTSTAKAALKRTGVSEQAFTEKYGNKQTPDQMLSSINQQFGAPSVPGSAVGAGSKSVSAPVQITVNAAPGQSSEEVAAAVGNVLQGHISDAAAQSWGGE